MKLISQMPYAPADGGAFIFPSKSSVQRLLHVTIFPRYDISLIRNRASHVNGHALRAHADCSPLRRSTAAEPSPRPSQTVRSISDADDNQTALWGPPTARFTDLGMSVSLPTFIQ